MTGIKTTRVHWVRLTHRAQGEQNWLSRQWVCAGSAERAVHSLWLRGAGYGLCCTLWTENHLQGKGEVQWLQQQRAQMLKHRNQSCCGVTLGEGEC